MDFEKAYKEVLEKAKKELATCGSMNCDAARQIIRFFPELAESEDEKIRRVIHQMMLWMRKETFTSQDNDVTKEKVLAWLEKQKEQKPSIEICPHSIKGKSYSETGYPIENCDYGLEIALNILQKTYGKVESYQTDDGIREHETAIQAVKDVMKEQKLAEWSEEDKDMWNRCVSSIEEAKENRYAYKETDGNTSYDEEINWLKSFRPQPRKEQDVEKYPEDKSFEDEWKDYYNNSLVSRLPMNKREAARHFYWFAKKSAWKPSEEQMDALKVTLEYMPDTFKPRCTLMTLQNDLEKLM